MLGQLYSVVVENKPWFRHDIGGELFDLVHANARTVCRPMLIFGKEVGESWIRNWIY